MNIGILLLGALAGQTVGSIAGQIERPSEDRNWMAVAILGATLVAALALAKRKG